MRGTVRPGDGWVEGGPCWPLGTDRALSRSWRGRGRTPVRRRRPGLRDRGTPSREPEIAALAGPLGAEGRSGRELGSPGSCSFPHNHLGATVREQRYFIKFGKSEPWVNLSVNDRRRLLPTRNVWPPRPVSIPVTGGISLPSSAAKEMGDSDR